MAEIRRLRLRPAPCATPARPFHRQQNSFREVLSNDKYGTGSLVARERQVAFERGGGCLYELVCTHGSGGCSERERSPVRSHALSQELDPGALCRARSFLLAG